MFEEMADGNFGFGLYFGVADGRLKLGIALGRWVFRIGETGRTTAK
jgi:hypothetical protein